MSVAPLIMRAGNEAVNINPPMADLDLTTSGSSFLWAVFSIMAATGLGTSVWAFASVDRNNRTFHYLSVAILTTASVAYFAMASDLGETPVEVEFIRDSFDIYQQNGGRLTRGIWYARYIDWTITTPLLLLELLLVSGLPLSTIFITIFFDIVMIITGLIGALVPSTYKWGFYTLGCVAMFYVFWVLFGPGRTTANAVSAENGRIYFQGVIVLSFLWFLYPIAWGLADGGNVISTDGEMVFYGVLDVLAKPVFALYHLFSLRKTNFALVPLGMGEHASSHAVTGQTTHHSDTISGNPAGHGHNNITTGAGSALPKRDSHAPTEATVA